MSMMVSSSSSHGGAATIRRAAAMMAMASWIVTRTLGRKAVASSSFLPVVSAYFSPFPPLATTRGVASSWSSKREDLSFASFSTTTSTSRGKQRRRRHGRHYGKKKGDADDLYRADRVLANRTGMSRSECFKLLKEKRVYQVPQQQQQQQNDNNNGDKEESLQLQVITGPSEKLSMHVDLRIDRKHVVAMPPPLLTVYHKPKWVLSVRNDPLGRPCLDNILKDNNNMHPVGRLDYDTSGLLLFSSSGALTQTLLHPKSGIPKEYVATVTGHVDEGKLRQQLQEGVSTGEGIHTATLLSCSHFDDDSSNDDNDSVRRYLDHVRANLPREYNQTDLQLRGYLRVLDPTVVNELSTVRLEVTEGKHRMVRRMLANVGHPVVSLRRERIGNIKLNNSDNGDRMNLPEGSVRQLTAQELQWAESLQPKKKRKKK